MSQLIRDSPRFSAVQEGMMATISSETYYYLMELEAAQAEKAKKAKKDPNAPKRAMSSFLFYSNEVRGHVSSQNPSMKLTDVSKEIGRRWKEMDSSEKLKYETLAADDKERYKREKSDFDKIGEGEKKKEDGAAVEERRRTMQVDRRAAGGVKPPCKLT